MGSSSPKGSSTANPPCDGNGLCSDGLVCDLVAATAAATFVLPPESMAAVEIPDIGAPKAWTYGETQRRLASGPQVLAAGIGGPGATTDAGATVGAGKAVGMGCSPDGSFSCSSVVLTDPAITLLGTMKGAAMSFGSGNNTWGSYTYAATGQSAPTATVTSDGNGIQIVAAFVDPIDPNNNYEGVGLYFNSSQCVNVSAYLGVKFDLEGDLGGCSLALGATATGDITPSEDSQRGGCSGTSSTCYGASASVVTNGATAIVVPFSTLTGGRPVSTLDPSSLVNVQWQLAGPTSSANAGGCAANITVSNVSFY
jgi:hypothetical protein